MPGSTAFSCCAPTPKSPLFRSKHRRCGQRRYEAASDQLQRRDLDRLGLACGKGDFPLPEPAGSAILVSKLPGIWRMSVEITAQSSSASPILVTGAAGAVGSIGRNLTEMLLAKGHKVRALVRREDGRAEALRQLGAEVMQGNLTDLTAMHRAIDGCVRIYFGMSVSADYLTATVNTAAVARHHGVEAFVNMSQMTVTQMSVTETTESPQHKLHWLAEQALSWSGLPVVTVRPTVFLDGFFRIFAAPGVRHADELALPMGVGKTSPIWAVDVARAVSVVLDNPAPHIGQIYNLTGFESADLSTTHACCPMRWGEQSAIATCRSPAGAKSSSRRACRRIRSSTFA